MVVCLTGLSRWITFFQLKCESWNYRSALLPLVHALFRFHHGSRLLNIDRSSYLYVVCASKPSLVRHELSKRRCGARVATGKSPISTTTATQCCCHVIRVDPLPITFFPRSVDLLTSGVVRWVCTAEGGRIQSRVSTER